MEDMDLGLLLHSALSIDDIDQLLMPLRFVGIHGNLGLLMLHEHVGTLYFTDHFRVVMVAQARNSLT